MKGWEMTATAADGLIQLEVSSHNQQLLFALCHSESFAAVCVRVECHLHILSFATDLSVRSVGLQAIAEEIGCQYNNK
mgnify:FL=1